MKRGALVTVAAIAVAATAVWVLWLGRVCACSNAAPAPVDGIVVQVDATGLTAVSGFDLRPDNGGPVLHFTLGSTENPTQFPPGHLKEHQASGSPIRVYYTVQADVRVAYRLEDAPAATGNP